MKDKVQIIEDQIHSEVADFSLFEKMKYMYEFFGNDPEFSEALPIVVSKICMHEKRLSQ